MTRFSITSYFPAGTPLHFGGREFAVPTLSWLQGPCWDFFKERYWSDDLDRWRFRWDCQDITRAFACVAQECHALTAGGAAEADALAVGEFWYRPATAGVNAAGRAVGHALNACITDQGLRFLEPQNRTLVTLTPAEIDTCSFARF